MKLIKVDREKLSVKNITLNKTARNSLSNRFPLDLDSDKIVMIHVYDTTKAENVYNGLVDTTQNVMAHTSSFFGDMANKALDYVGVDSRFSSSATTAAGGLFGSSGEGIKDMFTKMTNSLPNIDLGVANASLSKRYSYHESFYLPIPNNLQEEISNEYEEKQGWINDMPFVQSARNAVIQPIEEKSAIWSKLTGARSLKYWENKIQMYTSSGFREITLTWNLSPNNSKESIILHEIVRKIKMYGSAESVAGKLLIKSPCFFGLEFNNKILNQALQFDEVVLISASIDYVPGGNMETYNDNMPKHIQLNMTFRDREPKLREDWETTKNTNGPDQNDVSCPS